MKPLLIALAAGLAGALVVVACSDDAPHDADAATCDCPAREAPLTTARVHRVDDLAAIPASGGGTPIAGCPTGELLLTGGCYVAIDTTANGLVLEASYAHPEAPTAVADSWACRWHNTSATGTAEVHAQALCLRPAP